MATMHRSADGGWRRCAAQSPASCKAQSKESGEEPMRHANSMKEMEDIEAEIALKNGEPKPFRKKTPAEKDRPYHETHPNDNPVRNAVIAHARNTVQQALAEGKTRGANVEKPTGTTTKKTSAEADRAYHEAHPNENASDAQARAAGRHAFVARKEEMNKAITDFKQRMYENATPDYYDETTKTRFAYLTEDQALLAEQADLDSDDFDNDIVRTIHKFATEDVVRRGVTEDDSNYSEQVRSAFMKHADTFKNVRNETAREIEQLKDQEFTEAMDTYHKEQGGLY